MNLVAELGKKHSLATKNKIIRYVGTNTKRFDDLVKIFLGDTYRLTQWAGWPLSDIVKKHPELIRPYLKPVLKTIDRPGMHVAVKRNVMRLLQFIDIPPNVRGLAFDKAFKLFTDTSEPVAVRVFSMTVMTDIALKEPGLKNEVIVAIEEQLPFGSAGYKSRAAKLLKALRK
ncbi:MAG: hypothetical protein WDO14_22645 [Bacteroidota bacterium]